ncbi:MAG: sterol-binding protein [Candidatus Hydrogenedens sp.]|nr:sterol-binding protein [Candidatus Hydrogenedens sp.]
MSQVSDFFAAAPDKVNKDKIAGMNAVYQFNIDGPDGGQWAVKLADGDASVIEGAADSPNITISMTDENFVGLVTGKLNGQTAFLTGKLKIQGDMTLAMKLQQVFNFG